MKFLFLHKRSVHLQRWGIPTALFFLSILPFLPALNGEFLNWDDATLLVENSNHHPLGWTALFWMLNTNAFGHYMPLTWFSYSLNAGIFGNQPWGFHLVNTVLHGFNTVLFFVLLLQFMGRDLPLRTRTAFLISLFWGWHPFRVESVAWITERRDVLSAFFILPALLFYLKSERCLPIARRQWRWLGLFTYGLSLMAKASGVPFPIVLCLIDYWNTRRNGTIFIWRAALKKLAPFFILAMIFGIKAMDAQLESNATLAFSLTRGEIPFYHWLLKCFQIAHSLGFYILGSAFPFANRPLYVFPEAIKPTDVTTALLGATFVLSAAFYRKMRPGFFCVMAAYTALVLPISGIFQSGPQFVAERYSYLAAMPLLLGLAIALLSTNFSKINLLINKFSSSFRLSRKSSAPLPDSTSITGFDSTHPNFPLTRIPQLGARTETKKAGDFTNKKVQAVAGTTDKLFCEGKTPEFFVESRDPTGEFGLTSFLGQSPGFHGKKKFLFVVILLLAYGARTTYYSSRWRDSVRLWEYAVEKDPRIAMLRAHLGAAYLKVGRTQEGLDQLQMALDLDPSDNKALIAFGDYHSSRGEWKSSRPFYERALARHRHFAPAWERCGQWYFITKDYHSSRTHFQQAVRLKPNFWEAYCGWGAAELGLGNPAAALNPLKRGLALNPASPDLHNNLGICYMALGNTERALFHAKWAVKMAPANQTFRINLQRLEARRGNLLSNDP